MSDYISRDELLELYAPDPDCDKGSVPFPVVRQNILDMPAADVALVRHGRWIDSNKRPVPWDEQNPTCPLYSAYCSECGEWLTGSGEYPAIGLYCPNCGARMDKEDKHEAD